MEISQKQAEERLNNPENLASRFSVIEIPIMRPGKNRPNLTPAQREEIAIRSRTGEKQTDLAKEFGITQGNVSHIERGKTEIDETTVTPAVQSIQDKALNRLMSTLGLLDDDRLSGCNAKDLSVIAGNMAKVVALTTAKEKSDNHTTVIVYSPETRGEHTFRTASV